MVMSTLDTEQPSLSGHSPKNGVNILDELVVIAEPFETAEAAYWTTSRRELWAFYLYYVVRFLRVFRPTIICS